MMALCRAVLFSPSALPHEFTFKIWYHS